MGKHFRIEGAPRLRKDGLNERRNFRVAGNVRHSQAKAGASRPADGGVWSAAPLALVLAISTFWGVWTLTAPAEVGVNGYRSATSANDLESAHFSFCHTGGGSNCVVDGDTFYYGGTKIRIADIDTPETHDAQCDAEQQRGDAATQRLIVLVNAGPFSLQSVDRDEDRYGRKLRVLTRGGDSLGGILVNEGLARWYEGGRRSWC